MIIDIGGESWTKDQINKISFEDVKYLLSFIEDERKFMIVAKWHSDEAEDYALSVLDNL